MKGTAPAPADWSWPMLDFATSSLVWDHFGGWSNWQESVTGPEGTQKRQ